MARCWAEEGLGYGYAFIALDHYISSKDPVSWSSTLLYQHHNTTDGYELSNSTNWFGNPGDCFYTTGLFFFADLNVGLSTTRTPPEICACLPADTPDPDDPGGPDSQCDDSQNPDNNEQYVPCESPIVINLDAGGYALTDVARGVTFDLAGDGTSRQTAWTMAGSEQAFVALDLDDNGVITTGRELFGSATRLSDGRRAPHGFAALAEYDENRDGVINARDNVWRALLLWTDRDHDGRSSSDEVQALSASAVTFITTDAHWSGRRDKHGNQFRWQALVGFGVSVRPVYDIWFVQGR
ncbi:MAG: hypothetical protein WA208_18655 [Thermoanaerobaculia bacterium]